MEALFDRKGRLSVIAARGWISGWEASRLSAGSLLVSETIAGEGAQLLYEGRFAARCEVAILGAAAPEICAVKITDLERPAREDAEPDRGDELAELLPFEVEYCDAGYSLSELRGAGVGTIVSLDAAYDSARAATLLVAGMPAGEGRIVVVGEKFGILLDSVVPAGAFAAPRRETGSLVAAPETAPGAAPMAKVYDWKRPDRFTKASLLGLEAVHELALDALGARIPALAEYRIECCDQLSWGELARDGGARPDSILRAAMERPRREYERERQRASPPAAFIQPSRPKFALSASDGARIARWLEEERARADDRPLFALASGSAAAALEEPRSLLDCLASGWRRVCDYSFARAERLDAAPLLAYGDDGAAGDERGLFDGEMVAVVYLRGSGGTLALAYSGRAVYPVIGALERYGRLRMPL